MEEKIGQKIGADVSKTRDTTQDVVLNVKVHDQSLLGWVNQNNKYVIPGQIIKEIIDAKKLVKRVDKNNIFLVVQCPNIKKEINMVMTYLINDTKDKVFIRFATIEEEYLADGAEVRQLITEIHKDIMPFSKDILEQSFEKYHILKKIDDEDPNQRSMENPKYTESTIGLHEEVSKIAEEDFELASEKAVLLLLKYLRNNPNDYNNMLLSQVEKNVENYKKFVLKSDVEAHFIPSKIILDILNNCVETTDAMMPNNHEKDIFHALRLNILNDYRSDIIASEKKAEEILLNNSDLASKLNFLNAISIKDSIRNQIREDEAIPFSENIELKDILSIKAQLMMEDTKKSIDIIQDQSNVGKIISNKKAYKNFNVNSDLKVGVTQQETIEETKSKIDELLSKRRQGVYNVRGGYTEVLNKNNNAKNTKEEAKKKPEDTNKKTSATSSNDNNTKPKSKSKGSGSSSIKPTVAKSKQTVVKPESVDKKTIRSSEELKELFHETNEEVSKEERNKNFISSSHSKASNALDNKDTSKEVQEKTSANNKGKSPNYSKETPNATSTVTKDLDGGASTEELIGFGSENVEVDLSKTVEKQESEARATHLVEEHKTNDNKGVINIEKQEVINRVLKGASEQGSNDVNKLDGDTNNLIVINEAIKIVDNVNNEQIILKKKSVEVFHHEKNLTHEEIEDTLGPN